MVFLCMCPLFFLTESYNPSILTSRPTAATLHPPWTLRWISGYSHFSSSCIIIAPLDGQNIHSLPLVSPGSRIEQDLGMMIPVPHVDFACPNRHYSHAHLGHRWSLLLLHKFKKAELRHLWHPVILVLARSRGQGRSCKGWIHMIMWESGWEDGISVLSHSAIC